MKNGGEKIPAPNANVSVRNQQFFTGVFCSIITRSWRAVKRKEIDRSKNMDKM